MKPYSNDLRRKMIAAYENNDYSQEEVAELFNVSPATVRNLVRRKRETGSTDALPHAGGRTATLSEKEQERLPSLVNDHNDATLAELCQLVKQKLKKSLSPSVMCRVLQKLGLPRKKRPSTPPSATPRASRRHGPITSV